MDADGLQTLDDWGNLTVVQVDPDDGGDDAGDGVGQEVAQTETGNVLDDKRIDDHSQRKGGDDHDRHLDDGVEQHMADTSPEFAGSDDVLEVLESDELVDQFAAAIEAATLADLTEEAGIDGPDDGQEEHEGEQDGERRHERPAGSVLALECLRALWLCGGAFRRGTLGLSNGCSHNTNLSFRKTEKRFHEHVLLDI